MRQLINSFREKLFVQSIFWRFSELRHVYSIHSHLTSHERYELFRLARNKEKILEIGSYVGASAACFGAAKNRFTGGEIYCIDTWQNDAMTEGKKDTYETFTENTKPYSKWIIPIRGLSTEVVEDVRKHTATIDLLFIDGDHSYEGVKADWETYRRFLKQGSVVVFHDFGWAEGVQKVIQDDVKPWASKFDSLPNMWWATIVEIDS
jgi:predicted O-methyltransferase YrrM